MKVRGLVLSAMLLCGGVSYGDDLGGLLALHGVGSGGSSKVHLKGVGGRYGGVLRGDKGILELDSLGNLHLGGEVFKLGGVNLVGGVQGRVWLGKEWGGKKVSCVVSGGELNRVGRCSYIADGRDIGSVLVSGGWGLGEGKEYLPEAKGAKLKGIGVWSK